MGILNPVLKSSNHAIYAKQNILYISDFLYIFKPEILLGKLKIKWRTLQKYVSFDRHICGFREDYPNNYSQSII